MRLSLVLPSALALALLASPSFAQSPQDRATARLAAEEADKKLAAKDYDGALDLFTKADALVPAPTLKLQIGRVQAQRGKLVEAQQILIDASRSAPTAGEPPSWAKAREDAAKEAAAIKARIPALEITIEGPPKDKPVKVTIDGEAVNPATLGLPRATNPGQHTVRAEADGYQPAETTLALKEGDRTPLVLKLTATSGAAAVVVPPPPPPGQGDQPAQPAKKWEPPPPASAPGARTHDGFFLRMGLGVAFHSSSVKQTPSDSGVSGAKIELTGSGVAVDFQIGGAVSKGVVLAADLGGHVIDGPDRKVTPDSTSVSRTDKLPGKVSYSRFGGVVVIYPNPTGGFHLFGGGGFGTAQVTPDNTSIDPVKVSGPQINGGVGYEGWIGNEWSLGGLLRLDVPFLKGTEKNVPITNSAGRIVGTTDVKDDVTGVIPSIVLNLTYNLPGDAGIACFSGSSPGPDPAW